MVMACHQRKWMLFNLQALGAQLQLGMRHLMYKILHQGAKL